MARVLYGSIVTQLSGSIGGTVFARNASGNTCRRKSRNIKRNTVKMSTFRNSFGFIQRSWRGIDAASRTTWSTNANLFPYVNSLGITHYYTGFQLYSKFNNQLFNVGAPLLVTAPTPSTMSAITVATSVFTADTDFFEFSFIDSVGLTSVVPVGFILQLFATTNLSLGISSPNIGAFKMLYLYQGGVNTSFINLADRYFDTFGSLPLSSSNVFLSARYVNTATGEVGSFVRLIVTVV